jgi:hypothetical protein
VSVIVERFAVIEYPDEAEFTSSSRAIHIRSMPTDCLDFPLYDLSLLRGMMQKIKYTLVHVFTLLHLSHIDDTDRFITDRQIDIILRKKMKKPCSGAPGL